MYMRICVWAKSLEKQSPKIHVIVYQGCMCLAYLDKSEWIRYQTLVWRNWAENVLCEVDGNTTLIETPKFHHMFWFTLLCQLCETGPSTSESLAPANCGFVASSSSEVSSSSSRFTLSSVWLELTKEGMSGSVSPACDMSLVCNDQRPEITTMIFYECGGAISSVLEDCLCGKCVCDGNWEDYKYCCTVTTSFENAMRTTTAVVFFVTDRSRQSCKCRMAR